jgi:hypothetical protein
VSWDCAWRCLVAHVLLLAFASVAAARGALAADVEVPQVSSRDCYSLVPERSSDGSPVQPQPVCVALTRNLNEFCASAPHVCSIPLSTKYPDLREPTWRPLDPAKNFTLIEKLVRGNWMPNRERDPQGYNRVVTEVLSRFRQSLSEGHLRLHEAAFDFANGLGIEPVYRIDTGQCAAELAAWKRNPRVKSMQESLGSDAPLTEMMKGVRATMLAQRDPILYLGRAADVAEGIRPLTPRQLGDPTFEGRSLSGRLGSTVLYDSRTHLVTWTVGMDRLEVLRPRAVRPAGWADPLCTIQFNFPGQKFSRSKE